MCCIYNKNSLVHLCVMNNSNDGLSLHVVSAVQDNCVDSKLLKLASEDRVPILELAGESFFYLMKMPSTEHSKEWFRHYMSAINIVLFKLEGKISDVGQYLLSVSIILYVYNYI